ncbi:MAG: hypothetical protein KF790_06330 [Steroidobacteraceae bacterium]|nr:hypothetical protein [Steroidobacteraceae bacterium]MCW5571533.1 hypothetical protein [Steroidobacteraceae bacterium]
MATVTRNRSPLLAGLSHGWSTWFEMMGRSQDLSAPWRTATDRHARAWTKQRRQVGPYESMSSGK